MNILLSGQKYFGAETLRLLMARGENIVAVAAPPETEKGTPDRLWELAGVYGYDRVPSDRLKADTTPANVDLIVCAHSHAFLSEKTRLRALHGAIGYHPSLLPLHRGRDAVRWAVRAGDKVTGGTVYWLSNKVDGGDIAAQDYCFVPPGETPEGLWRKALMPMGLRLFNKVLDDISAGVLVKVPQDESLATWEPSLSPPRLHRPDLIMLGDGGPEAFKVQREVA